MKDATERVEEACWRRFPRHLAYKDSGIEWLGDIPSHWNLKRLKNVVARLESGATPESGNFSYWTDREHGIPWVAISDMTRGFRLYGTAKRITEEGRKSKRLRILPVGTLLYSMYASLGRVALLETEAVINQAILGIVPRGTEVLRDYLRWWFEYMQTHVQILSSSNTQDNLSAERVRNMPIVLPVAIEEQRAIANFLDDETANIDGLVERKERLVELLQEKRTTLITHAVTRGLDPDVPIKDSGIDWLGSIPIHWEMLRLKLLLQEPLHYGANEPAVLMDRDFPRYIRITDVSEDGHLRKETFRSIPEDVAGPHILQDGDLLFARSGATVGKTFRYEPSWGRAAHAGYLIRARLKSRSYSSRFVQYFTTSTCYWDWLRSIFIQATIQNVSADRFANLRIPMPKMEEQQTIVHHLDRLTAEIDTLITRIQDASSLLKEYRTALISAAVTGKIDIRAASTHATASHGGMP